MACQMLLAELALHKTLVINTSSQKRCSACCVLGDSCVAHQDIGSVQVKREKGLQVLLFLHKLIPLCSYYMFPGFF